MEDQEITLDESDVLIPEPIEQMHLAPKEKQVEVKTIQRDYNDRKTEPEPSEPIKVEMLPYLGIEETPKAPQWERPHDKAKEIYLHDLKLVDYTSYRSKPTVKTKQMVLSGTPASMEGEDSETDDPIWKEVDLPYSHFIDKSIGIFSKGSYKRALTRFETVIETYHDDVNANFYAGLCLYNLGEYDQAILAFKNCVFGPFSNFDEESQWMIALSYEKLGQRNQAKKYFKKIVEQGGFYKKQAAEKMK
jgi:tetratricopeptide (TPR) repeat protein